MLSILLLQKVHMKDSRSANSRSITTCRIPGTVSSSRSLCRQQPILLNELKAGRLYDQGKT